MLRPLLALCPVSDRGSPALFQRVFRWPKESPSIKS